MQKTNMQKYKMQKTLANSGNAIQANLVGLSYTPLSAFLRRWAADCLPPRGITAARPLFLLRHLGKILFWP